MQKQHTARFAKGILSGFLSAWIVLVWMHFHMPRISPWIAVPLTFLFGWLVGALVELTLHPIQHFWHYLTASFFNRRVLVAALSLCISYLVLVFLFAMIFATLHIALGTEAFRSSETLSFSDFFYFSAVTATTLGYGDITPLHPIAKALSVLEVLFTVLIVGIYLSAVIGTGGGQNKKNGSKNGSANEF